MSLLALIMWAVLSGNTIIEYGKQPLDINLVEQVSTQQSVQASEENQPQEELPFLEWKWTWYDYKLWGKWYSKYNDTCALRIKDRWWHYKVCAGDKCVVCRHNDYWPAEYTNKVIDLSSHAFKQLAPLSKWVIEVLIYKID
jgi:hypothetical protein